MARLVFVPPVPLNAFPYKRFDLVVKRVTIGEIKREVEFAKEAGVPIENYIRHESTVRVLNEALGLDLKPSSALYQHKYGDTIIVVGLKKPVRGQEVQVSLEDLDLAIIQVHVWEE